MEEDRLRGTHARRQSDVRAIRSRPRDVWRRHSVGGHGARLRPGRATLLCFLRCRAAIAKPGNSRVINARDDGNLWKMATGIEWRLHLGRGLKMGSYSEVGTGAGR